MLKPDAKITIFSAKTWIFGKITNCEIERDVANITATCKLTLPKNTIWHGEKTIPVRRGDKVKIELGFNNALETVFEGYVKSISAKTPVEIACEDNMFILKQTAAKKKTYKNGDLKQILNDQLPKGMKSVVYGRQSWGQYTVNTDTVAQLLGALSENGIMSFFRGDTLYSGMIFDHSAQLTGLKPTYRTGERGNIIDDGDLKENKADEINLRIRAKGTDKKGKKIQVEVGDKDGELRTFFKYNTTKEELTAEAKAKLTEWKVDGLTGSFGTFGGHAHELLDIIRVELDGVNKGFYKVTKNTISYGAGGYHQTISIGGQTK